MRDHTTLSWGREGIQSGQRVVDGQTPQILGAVRRAICWSVDVVGGTGPRAASGRRGGSRDLKKDLALNLRGFWRFFFFLKSAYPRECKGLNPTDLVILRTLPHSNGSDTPGVRRSESAKDQDLQTQPRRLPSSHLYHRIPSTGRLSGDSQTGQ